MNNILDKLDTEIALIQKIKNILSAHPELLTIKTSITRSNNYLFFRELNHEDSVKIIASIGGKWTKSYSGDKVDYIKEHNDIWLYIADSTPPPNCKIVETSVTIPAVPEHTVIRKTLICPVILTEKTTIDASDL